LAQAGAAFERDRRRRSFENPFRAACRDVQQRHLDPYIIEAMALALRFASSSIVALRTAVVEARSRG
jgi:hypothetical protein